MSVPHSSAAPTDQADTYSSNAARTITSSPALGTYAAAFAWGVAEAVAFFIVPDVLLTRIALRDVRRAALAGLWALLGALLGGIVLWSAARHDSTQFLLNAFDWIPGISRELIVRTAQALHTHGVGAIVTGLLAGQPFKLYAVHAGAQQVTLAAFLAAATAAHLVRFALTVGLVWLVGRALRHRTETFRLRLHLYGWMGFYCAYFVIVR
jgi:membrane protein DedA with SNARE-associated domain